MIRLALRNYHGTWETWEDELTMPRLEGMLDELRDQLPLHIAVMAGLGVKPNDSSGSVSGETLSGNDAIFTLLGMSPGGNFDPNRVPTR